jgi:hypothetical protein
MKKENGKLRSLFYCRMLSSGIWRHVIWNIFQTTRRHIAGDSTVPSHPRESLKSWFYWRTNDMKSRRRMVCTRNPWKAGTSWTPERLPDSHKGVYSVGLIRQITQKSIRQPKHSKILPLNAWLLLYRWATLIWFCISRPYFSYGKFSTTRNIWNQNLQGNSISKMLCFYITLLSHLLLLKRTSSDTINRFYIRFMTLYGNTILRKRPQKKAANRPTWREFESGTQWVPNI